MVQLISASVMVFEQRKYSYFSTGLLVLVPVLVAIVDFTTIQTIPPLEPPK